MDNSIGYLFVVGRDRGRRASVPDPLNEEQPHGPVVGAVTFDCEHALDLARFWAAALGREVGQAQPPRSEHFAIVPPPQGGDGSPLLIFIQVPEGKTVKNPVHLDLAAGDRDAEIERLIGLGARDIRDEAEWGVNWTTLADPEGKEICVAGHRSPRIHGRL